MFVCDKAFEVQARGLMERSVTKRVAVRRIMAGKFRRYSHLNFFQHLTVPHVVTGNLTDIFRVIGGVCQSIGIIMHFHPDVVFAKGGYVCLPIGIAAHILRVPIVVHDSDTRPGLTNRVLGRWAKAIGTGSPLENYRYPLDISRYVGVPISPEFHPYTDEKQRAAKLKLGFDEHAPLVVVTGGGLGSVSINSAVVRDAHKLLGGGVAIYHVTGKQHIDDVKLAAVQDARYMITPFVYEGMATVLGAADVVISRASATFIQELAGLAKPSILIPSRALSDQRKNAVIFAEAGSAIVLTDDDILEEGVLAATVLRVLSDRSYADQLAQTLHGFARPHAARDMAQMIIDTTRTT